HQNWAGYRGASLHQYEQLQAVYEQLLDPIIVKDQPEVFVNVNTPKDEDAQGLWIFASNWTVPTDPEMMDKRLVQGHFNSAVKPVQAELGIRSDGIGAIYDVINAQQVSLQERDGRLYFNAELDGVEGRIYAALPEAIAAIHVSVPEEVTSGQRFTPRIRYQGESGADLAIMGNVQITVRDNFGNQLNQRRRAVLADGILPSVQVPAGINALQVEVIDTIAGHMVTVDVPVNMAGLQQVGQQSNLVTTYRADRIHDWFASQRDAGEEIIVLIDSGALSFEDGAVAVEEANPYADQLQTWANGIAESLRSAGLSARVARSEDVVTSRLHAHPWTGRMASYRARHSVPSYRIDAPVVLVGSPRTSPIIEALDRSMVLQRSAQIDAVFANRGLIAWNPRSFAPDQHAIVVALDDNAALAGLQERLQSLISQQQSVDSYYQAREWVRFAWSPSEVQIHKRDRGLFADSGNTMDHGAQREVSSDQRWAGLTATVGTAIFDLRASPGGVAIGTKSWVRPTGAISPDGDILGFWGGNDEITPRDVAISADGSHVAAGYALLGRSVIYEIGGDRQIKHRSGIVHSANMFRWDSFKESDRHIGANPQGTQFLLVSGDALIAYDARSLEEQWRIPMVAPLARQQGQPQPEIAYSPDGRYLLAQPRIQDPQPLDVEVVVERWVQRSDGSWDEDETTEQRVQLRCDVHRHELWLIDARSGEPKWRRLINKKLIDQATGRLLWRAGDDIEYQQEINGNWRSWSAADEHELPYVNGRPIDDPPLLRVPFWHLYSTVGPDGEWAIAGAREPRISLFDDEGKILRSWDERGLPDALQAGDEIPVHVVPSRDPRRILTFAPQRQSFIVYDLIIGDAATRRQARELSEKYDQLIRTIREEVRNRRNYRNYGDQDYLDAFAERISDVPEDLRDNLISRMSRVPAERRAGRRRDHRFFSSQIEDIEERLFQIGTPVFDAAAGMEEVTRLNVDALICDAAVDERLRVVYASLWDGTVRALDVASGEELWRTEIIGGARMDIVLDDNGQVEALYAGGSRGDLYRLNPDDGSIIWHRNITAETNRFDPQ
ncbi:MAG: hypothetical protein EA401_13945, partial [Planctomycetota bacterium]